MHRPIALVSAADFQLSGNQFVLRHGNYPVLPGSFCDDPNEGATRYNEALTRYLNYNRRRTDLRVGMLLEKYAGNRRIRKLRGLIERSLSSSIDLSGFSQIEQALFLWMLRYS